MPAFSDLFKKAAALDEFWTEELVAEFTEELARWMENAGVSRSELADRIGHRPSYVTKVLRGNVNFTLASVSKLSRAVGARPRIHLAPMQCARTVYYDVMDSSPAGTAVTRLEIPSVAEPLRAKAEDSSSSAENYSEAWG